MAELVKQAGWSQTKPRLHHFRTQTGQEVDVVLEDAKHRCVGVEVKMSAGVGAKEFSAFRMMSEAMGSRFARGVVLYTGREVIPFAKNLHAVPIGALWQKGANP